MADIVMSEEAEKDLERIGDYIALHQKSPKAALNAIHKIKTRIYELKRFPLMGRPLSSIIEADTDYRFLGCGIYLTFYRVQNDNVIIDRILHGRQDYISILLGDIAEAE